METTFNFTDYSELTANTGVVSISTANSNLDGSGSTTLVLTGNSEGTIVNSLIIKATQATTQGMIRFFIKNSGGTQLLMEVPVPATTPTAVQPSFETRVSCDLNLANLNQLLVSTENAESFTIIAEGIDWHYPDTPSCCDHMKRRANNGFNDVNTGNSNLDGTGAIVDILTAGNNGTSLQSIFVKGQSNTTEGMVRLFISNDGGTTYYLFTEISIPANRQTGVVPSTINWTQNYNLILQNSYIIAASTENTETFSIMINSLDWTY